MKSLLGLLPTGWGLFQLGVEKVAAKVMGPGIKPVKRNPPIGDPYDDEDDDEDDDDFEDDDDEFDDDDEDGDDDDELE